MKAIAEYEKDVNDLCKAIFASKKLGMKEKEKELIDKTEKKISKKKKAYPYMMCH